MKHSWTDIEQERLLKLRALGMAWKDIANEMGMTIWQVSSMWRHIVKVRKGKPKRPIVFRSQSSGTRRVYSQAKPKWDFSNQNI